MEEAGTMVLIALFCVLAMAASAKYFDKRAACPFICEAR